MSRRGAIFTAVAAACIAGAAAYVLAAGGASAPAARAGGDASLGTAGVAPALRATRVSSGDLLVVDNDDTHLNTFGAIADLGGTRPFTRRFATTPDLQCLRIHFAGGRGICLTWGSSGKFGSVYSAKLLDARFNVTGKIALAGPPSRARVSPDGRYAAATTFASGHSYSEPGKFSTQTLLIDLERGSVVANLERFAVTRGGERVDAPDVNFWGVTFARDSNRFYATLATGGRTYLVEGDVAARSARTLRANVECPSLSPDGTRVGYKRFVGLDVNGGRRWRLHVLDLRTMRDVAVAERASIDDQVEWLGERLLYAKGKDVWAVPSDGSGRPTRLVRNAYSPAVAR